MLDLPGTNRKGAVLLRNFLRLVMIRGADPGDGNARSGTLYVRGYVFMEVGCTVTEAVPTTDDCDLVGCLGGIPRCFILVMLQCFAGLPQKRPDKQQANKSHLVPEFSASHGRT